MDPTADIHLPELGRRPSVSEAARPDLSVLALALETSQRLRALLGLKLAPLGLAPGQDRLLIALSKQGAMSVSAVSTVINVRPSTASKMTDRLLAKGYLRRLSDTDDRRRTIVEVTDEGLVLCERLQALCQALDADLRSSLSSADNRRMIEGIGLLNEAVDQRLRRLR